jgi:LysM repeat protein
MARSAADRSYRLIGSIAVIVLGASTSAAGSSGAARPDARPPAAEIVPVERFSPALLGVYRKVMEIEDEIIRHADRYGVDVTLARAVCMYESGGNANLTSSAGAQGYFQVMPSTFRLLGVKTNIEAGLKYLGQMVRQFGREDYALAAYNGGPGNVSRGRPMRLESLQYVMGISTYWSVLKSYEPSIRAHAEGLELTAIRDGEDWWALSQRLQLPVIQLRLHNPFLAARPLRPGNVVAYPPRPRDDVFDLSTEGPRYLTKLGDNYLNVAFILGLTIDQLRDANRLWRLESLLPDVALTIPRGPGTFTEYVVQAGDALLALASRFEADPWAIVRDNFLWSEQLMEGAVLRIRNAPPPPPRPAYVTHVVRRGETLSGLAERYDTTVRTLQAANGLGRRTLVKVGQRLRIPQ